MSPSRDSQKAFESLFQRRIVLYGAGVTGVETFKVLTNYFDGINIACFCDTYKTGCMIGVPIISPHQLGEICKIESVIVVVTGLLNNHKEIVDTLQRLDIPAECIRTLPEFDKLIVENIGDTRINEWYRTIKRCKGSLRNDRVPSLYLDWWCPEHYCDNDIVVYQPGKVGSSTVCNSLYTIGINATHVHMLTDCFLYDLIPELAWEPTVVEFEAIRKISSHCIDKIKQPKPLKIVTLVREPISRDYSHFLYHMDELVRSGYLKAEDSMLAACSEGIIKRATQNGRYKYGYQFEWFNEELKAVFGIDVYRYPFDRDKGYSIIRNGNIEVLVIKLERLNDLERVIGEFVNAPHLKLINANEAARKGYRDLYKSMRDVIKIPRQVIDMYYRNNHFMDHFYSEEEKKAFLNSW